MRQLRLRFWRERRALSLGELSARSGVTKAAISALEKPNHRTPRPVTVRKLAAALAIEPHELYAEQESADERGEVHT